MTMPTALAAARRALLDDYKGLSKDEALAVAGLGVELSVVDLREVPEQLRGQGIALGDEVLDPVEELVVGEGLRGVVHRWAPWSKTT